MKKGEWDRRRQEKRKGGVVRVRVRIGGGQINEEGSREI